MVEGGVLSSHPPVPLFHHELQIIPNGYRSIKCFQFLGSLHFLRSVFFTASLPSGPEAVPVTYVKVVSIEARLMMSFPQQYQ